KHFDEIVHPAVRKASFELLYKPLLSRIPAAELAARVSGHPDPARARTFIEASASAVDFTAVRDAVGRFREIITRLDIALEGQPWLSGVAFGLADAALAPFVERLHHLGMQTLWKDCLRADEWSRRVLSRDSVARSRAPAERRFPAPSSENQQW